MEETRHHAHLAIGQQQALRRHRLMAAERLDKHIAIFLPASRTTDMGLRDSLHHLWPWRPSGIGHRQTVGTWLHHPKRSSRTHKHPALTLAANERIDTTPQLRMDYCRERQKNDQKDIARHRMKDITNKTPQKQDATFPLLLTKKLRQQRYA